MICYNPPHMDDVQTSKKKMPSKQEWRGFYSLILIQAQNAFNEKAAQFLLIPLGVWLASTNAAYGPDSWVNSLQYILACIFVLPYILFSPFVGWLADCFCKARIIQFMSFLQILVLGAMLLCYKYENIEMAVFWFCVFSVQATILSPAKKGVVKDMVGSRQLGYASGLMEMSLILSMLAAQIGIFAWFDILQVSSNDGWEAAAFPTFILTCIAVPAVSGQPDQEIRMEALLRTFRAAQVSLEPAGLEAQRNRRVLLLVPGRRPDAHLPPNRPGTPH